MSSIPMRVSLAVVSLATLAASVSACGLWPVSGLPGSVLFQDDFARSSSGWDVGRTNAYSSAYEAGQYRIAVELPNTDAWGNPGVRVSDVRIEVDAHQVAGPEDNLFGVICRYQDAGDFYFLLASTDGFSGIGLYQDGQRRLLSGTAMLPVVGLEPGIRDHHLTAICDHDTLSLYIDHVLASQASASTWGSGDVGLMAGTYQEPGLIFSFDNFSVLQAGGNSQP